MNSKSSLAQNRRQFLGAATVGAAGVALASNSFAQSAATNTAAVPARSTNPKHKFKFSLAAYSYRNQLQKKELTLHDFIDDCAKFGLEGTELTSYYFPKEPSPEFLYDLKTYAFKKGLDVSGTAIGNDFGHADKEKLAEQIAHTKAWVDHAEKMGTSVIRVFAGHQKKGLSAEATHKQMVASLEECCDYAGKHGVFLALENHGGPTATADGLLKFVNDVKSKWFGVNLDTGNFHTEDVYGDLEKVAPHAINVQVKVVTSGADRKRIPTDFDRLGKILKGSKYRGYVVLEYEENEDPRKECPRYLEILRKALA